MSTCARHLVFLKWWGRSFRQGRSLSPHLATHQWTFERSKNIHQWTLGQTSCMAEVSNTPFMGKEQLQVTIGVYRSSMLSHDHLPCRVSPVPHPKSVARPPPPPHWAPATPGHSRGADARPGGSASRSATERPSRIDDLLDMVNPSG